MVDRCLGRMVSSVLLLGCGPGIVPADGSGSGSGMSTGSTSTSSTTDASVDGPGTATTGTVDDTGIDPSPEGFCVEEHVIDGVDSSWYPQAVQFSPGGLPWVWLTDDSLHLVLAFGGYGGRDTVVYEMERIGDSWLFGDIDGDGLADGVARIRMAATGWYAGDARMGLAPVAAPITGSLVDNINALDDYDGDGLADALIRLGAYTEVFCSVGDGTGSFLPAGDHNFDPSGGFEIADLYPIEHLLGHWFVIQHELSCPGCTGAGLALGSLQDCDVQEHQRIDGLIMADIYGAMDRNGDGRPDLLVTLVDEFGGDLEDLVWLDTTPEGTFAVAPVEQDLLDVRPIDVDGDGQAEMLRRYPDDTRQLWHWDGAAYGLPDPVTGEPGSTFGGRVDLDGDGWTDFFDNVTDGAGGIIGKKIWTLRPCGA